jgi:amino acid transporter
MTSTQSSGGTGSSKLGWFLCWAVVFADIGTSLYYVPGILFGEVHNLAGLFVTLTSLVFILLVMKYIEITERYPEGGGVVTVATHAFGPWFGALGGMFITVDYFLTASISSVSGFAYLNSILPLGGFVMYMAILGLIGLGVLNVIGIKESAKVTAVIAVGAFIVDVILVVFVATQVGPEGWKEVFASLGKVSTLTPWALLTGFAGSFLAFSGLESISQLSPAMQEPRKKIATIAMVGVILSIVITSPLLTLFSTNLLTAKIPHSDETILEAVKKVKERETKLKLVTDPREKLVLEEEIKVGTEYSERFISELGAQYGGTLLKIAVVATASILLLFASNTAIIGAYHVFMALSRQNFLPYFMQRHNIRFGTPHISIAIAVVAPILIILMTRGNVNVLGALYAFGLLGAFGLSSVGLDVVRWREGKRTNFVFWLGILTSVLVLVAWGTNLYYKQLATIFGGSITLVGMIIAFINRRYFPHTHVKVTVTLASLDLLPKEGAVLVPVYDEFDPSLFEFISHYLKGTNRHAVILYIREFSDVLQTVAESFHLDEEAEHFMSRAKSILDTSKTPSHFLYASTSDLTGTINAFRKKIIPETVVVSPHRQSRVFEFLHGDVLPNLMKRKEGNILIHTGSFGKSK